MLLVKLADMTCEKLLPDLKFDSSRHCRFKMGVAKAGPVPEKKLN
jgi:hypothetical protein